VELISLLLLILPLAFVILTALGLCALAVLFMSRATVAMGTMAAILLLDIAPWRPPGVHWGLWVYLPDLLVILLLPAFFYRLLLLKKFDAIPRAWWLLGLLQLGLFVWGLAEYGTGAGVDYRQHFYLWLGAAYVATFDYDEAYARRFMKFFPMMGVGICAIAYYRWTMGELSFEFHRQLELFDTTGVAFPRPIASAPTFILTCAMLAGAYQIVTERVRPTVWLWVGLFGVTVVAMQHRSVWIATFAGFIALALALRQMRSGGGSKLFSMALAGTLLLALIAASGRFDEAVKSVQDQVLRATSTTSGTFVGRVVGWQALLKTWAGSGSPVTYLIGKPFGGGYEHYASDFGGEKLGMEPHNYYVHLLFRGGLVGLITFLWVFAQAARILWLRLRRSNDAMAPLLFAMLIAQLVYYIPYSVHYSQMILLGLLLGLITRERKEVRAAEQVILTEKVISQRLAGGVGGIRVPLLK
jgi:hypothetical protein